MLMMNNHHHHDDNAMINAQGQYGGQYETARVGQYDGVRGQFEGGVGSQRGQYEGAAALYNYPPPQMSPRYIRSYS